MNRPIPPSAAPDADPFEHFNDWYAVQRRLGAPAEPTPLVARAYLSGEARGRLDERTSFGGRLRAALAAPRHPSRPVVEGLLEAALRARANLRDWGADPNAATEAYEAARDALLDQIAPEIPEDVDGYAVAGPLLELDHLLTALATAIYEPCNDAHNADVDRCLPAMDTLAVDECKAIQRHVRQLLGMLPREA